MLPVPASQRREVPQSASPIVLPMLQRKCACGESSGLTGSCSQCEKKKLVGHSLQTKLRINEPGDAYEREADQVAQRAMVATAVNEQTNTAGTTSALTAPRQSAVTSQLPSAATPSVHAGLSSPGHPLDDPTRDFFEKRMGHDFSRVRIHSDDAAARSAHDLHARAYTSGQDIVFGAGDFSPATRAGRRLIAHELTHVLQQSPTERAGGRQIISPAARFGSSSPAIIQRQPDESHSNEEPPKQNPPQKTAPAKTLKSEGVDLADPVASGTAATIDAVLARNQKLAPYIHDSLTAGFKIAEKGKFVHDSTDANFDAAFRKAYDLDSSFNVPKDTRGFFDSRKSEIHLRPSAEFGTALHEAVHRLASPIMYKLVLPTANKISQDLTEVLKEGLTAYFTDLILKEEGLPNFKDAYRSKKKKAEELIAAFGANGFDVFATLNFKGTNIIEIGERLGVTRQQFSAAKGQGAKEVLKKMNKLL
jgi:hypothetical protein